MDKFEGPSGKYIHILAVIRGLESERSKVRRAVEVSNADIIGLSISEEELKGLDDFKSEDAPLANFEEDVYMKGLSKFGDVKKPPPCFLEARDIANKNGLRFVALDMNDTEYTEAYVNNVSTIEMIMQTKGESRLRRRSFRASTPLEFVLEFDNAVNARKGFKQLEKLREEHIARQLGRLNKKHANVLAVIEAERAKGVGQALSRYLPR